MKSQIVTKGIILARTDFQEADRILTVLTAEHGKLRLIAKGVRRPKSKLAGGIELFTVNELTVLPSRNELQTLISSRMSVHYGDIVKDIKKTMLGYEFLKRINRYTEDEPGPEYFEILEGAFAGLNDPELAIEYVELWFTVQLLKITGHSLNLMTDTEGNRLEAGESYLFDFESTSFRQQKAGPYSANHIKLLRLAYSTKSPVVLKHIQEVEDHLPGVLNLSKNALKQHISS